MNVIDTKNWTARINKMPSLQGPTFTVSGTVIVGNSATEACLAMAPVQDRSMGIRLELTLKEGAAGLTVLTEKPVTLALQGHVDTTHVVISHDGKELVTISDVEVVD
jgi:hypothetical protein